MFDYHVHTSFSADSRMPMEKACQEAVDKGIQEIAFTEHVDYFYPDSTFVWEFDYDQYRAAVEKLQQTFQNKLTILKAVEIGMHPQSHNKNRQFVQENEFDFIIGSVHIVDDLDLHNGDFFKEKTIDDALRIYFETVNRLVKEYADFHVLGHLDLIKRYVHHLQYQVEGINWRKYDDIIEDTLKHLIETGRGIEINMSGYRYRIDCALPDLPIVSLYKQLGGEIITIGSDAHTPSYIGRYFNVGFRLLHQAGFKYVSVFRNGQPQFVPCPA